ncbi:hypothetical protein ACWEQH_10540 [Streptomyces sp. NPDC004166]
MMTTQALLPALEDAYHAHAAVRDRLRAGAALAPPGSHQRMLERQADDMDERVYRIQHRARDLQPRGLLGGAADVARFAARITWKAASLPVTLGQKAVNGVMRGRGPADERRLLRHTEDEYTAAARALATARVGEVLADQAQDHAALDLFQAIRHHDMELLDLLEDSLAQQARSVAAARNDFRGEEPANENFPQVSTRPLRAAAEVADRRR